MGEKPDQHINNSSSCPECSKQCQECKEKILKMESKMLKMTIALTSAFTLLGQQAVEYIINIVANTEKITSDFNQEEIKNNKESKEISYIFENNKNNRNIDFSAHFTPYEIISGNQSDKKEIFLSDTRKYDNSGLNYKNSSYDWLLFDNNRIVEKTLLLSNYSESYTSKNQFSYKEYTENFIISSNIPNYDANLYNNIEIKIKDSGSTNYYYNIPNPSTICVLALGGIFNSRTRS